MSLSSVIVASFPDIPHTCHTTSLHQTQKQLKNGSKKKAFNQSRMLVCISVKSCHTLFRDSKHVLTRPSPSRSRYCKRTFDDENTLIIHQKAKHFRWYVYRADWQRFFGRSVHCLALHARTHALLSHSSPQPVLSSQAPAHNRTAHACAFGAQSNDGQVSAASLSAPLCTRCRDGSNFSRAVRVHTPHCVVRRSDMGCETHH